MNHTKEPWRAKADPSYYGIVSEIYAMDKFIASLGGVCSPDEVEANAKRIVACVNACADIDNEKLTMGCVKKQLEELVRVLNAVCVLFDNGVRKITVGECASLMIAEALINKYPKEWTD